MVSFDEKLDDFLVRYLAYNNYKKYVDSMDFVGSEVVLEVGSGGGNLTRFLASRVPDGVVYSIELDRYWLNRSKKRLRDFGNVVFIDSGFEYFVKRDYFDVAVVHYVLHDSLDKFVFVGRLASNLKRGGVLYLREPIRDGHGMRSSEIERLLLPYFMKEYSEESKSFPLKGTVYEGVFMKK